MSCMNWIGFDRLAKGRHLLVAFAVSATVLSGCHGSGDWAPLTSQKIYVSDKFFDVAPVGPKHAIVIGYGGKILETTDSGISWGIVPSGSNYSLYSIDFADDGKTGWIVGQEGFILKTIDGGKTWNEQVAEAYLDPDCRDPKLREQRLESERCDEAYLFAVSAIDANNVVAVGDRSVFTRSRDGGKTWQTETLTFIDPDMSPDWLLAFEDPVLYDIEFLDANNGYIVGEFGKIYHTTDGGESWTEQHKSLMDASVFDVLDMPTLFDVAFADAKNGIAVGLDGRIALTTDGGQDWNFVPNNVEDYGDPFYSAAILPDGTRWAVGASGQSVSAGSGKEFGRAVLGGAVYSWLRRIRFYDKDTAWVVGGFGLILNTHDGGKTWYRRIG